MEDKLNFKEALETGTAKFWKSLFYLLDHEEAAGKYLPYTEPRRPWHQGHDLE